MEIRSYGLSSHPFSLCQVELLLVKLHRQRKGSTELVIDSNNQTQVVLSL